MQSFSWTRLCPKARCPKARCSNVDAIATRISNYTKAIGTIEQTSSGEETEIDVTLKLQASPCQRSDRQLSGDKISENQVFTQLPSVQTTAQNTGEQASKPARQQTSPIENALAHEIASMETLIKYGLGKKLNRNPLSLQSQASFVSYGVDSVMAVELMLTTESYLLLTKEKISDKNWY